MHEIWTLWTRVLRALTQPVLMGLASLGVHGTWYPVRNGTGSVRTGYLAPRMPPEAAPKIRPRPAAGAGSSARAGWR